MKYISLIFRSKKILFCIFLLIWATILILTLRGTKSDYPISAIKNNLDQSTKPFELSPERGRYLLTYSLSESKSFSLTKEAADAAYPDVGFYKGKFYIYFPPGVSVLALPLYSLGKIFRLEQVFAFSTISIFALLNLILIYLISKKIFKLPFSLSIFSALVFGFASTSLSYAITLYQHQVTAFLILSSFLAVWKYKQINNRRALIYATYVWFCYGASLFVDYPNAILLLPVMIYFLLSSLKFQKLINSFEINFNLKIIFTSILFLAIMVVHGVYNKNHFGGYTKLSGGLIGYKTIKENNISTSQKNDVALTKLEEKKSPVGFFKEEHLPFSFYTLLFSDDRGIFLYSPIFILSIFGLITLLKKKVNLETTTALGVIAMNIFLYSSWGDPWGGWAFGPRYLIPSMPFLAILVAFWMNHTKLKIMSRIIAFLLFIPSCGVALLGALTTNAVPPKVEAVFLHSKYNFLFNWDFLLHDRSGSFAFNEFFSKYIDLPQYFVIILGILSLLALFVIFYLPEYETK